MARASIPPGVASWIARQDDANREAARRSLRKAKPRRKLNQQLRARLVDTAAGLMRRSEPSPFAFEGVIRTWLRSHLCLRGWQWADADFASEGVTDAALAKIGAKRPSWKEGQPEHTQEGYVLQERFHCANCGSILEGDQRKFCSTTCGFNFRSRTYLAMGLRERKALEEMERAT